MWSVRPARQAQPRANTNQRICVGSSCSRDSSLPPAFSGRGRPLHMDSSKLPARGFALEMFLPEGENYFRADGEHWFFHGEDVVFHRFHVELILLLVNRQELAACGNVGDLNNAFDDDCFLREFGADDTLRILRKIAGLA